MTSRSALYLIMTSLIVIAAFVMLSRDGNVEEDIVPSPPHGTPSKLDEAEGPVIGTQDNLDEPGQRVAAGVVTHRGVEVSEEFLTIAQPLLKRAVEHDFIQLDSELLIDRLRYTKAYMYAESGNYPTPETEDGGVDLELELLEGYSVDLAFTELEIKDLAGDQVVIIEGRIVGEDGGVFRLNLLGDGTMVRGNFESPERITRLETWEISTVSGVFQYERATIDEVEVDID